jgi:hypothetical protein
MALGRGVVNAALPGRAGAAIEQLESGREDYLLNAVSTLQSYTGLNEPGRARPSALEGLIAKAWAEVRESDREELAEVCQALAQGGYEGQSAASRLGRRAPVALYRDAGIRAYLEGGGKSVRSDRGGGGGGVGSSGAPLLGLVILAGLGSAVGYLATRPRVDEEAPKIQVEVPAEVGAPTTRIQGEVNEQDLASLSFEGQPVTFEASGPDRYRFTLELSELEIGANAFELEASDRQGRSSKRKFQITRAPYPAQITFSEPKPNGATRAREVRVAGKVVSEGHVASIRVGEQTLEVSADGSFAGEVRLPKAEGAHVLEASAHGEDAAGTASLRVIVDRSPPVIRIGAHPQKVYGASFDLPIKVDDHSDYVHLQVTGLGHLKPLHAGREHHVEVPVAKTGPHTIEVRAKDSLGNEARPVRVKITRVEAKDDLLAEFRNGQRSYRITKNIHVRQGQVLVVPARSRVEVSTGVEIKVEGKFLAPGTASGTIQISGKGWKGIRLLGPKAAAELRYTELRGGRNEDGGVLYLSAGAQAVLRRCTLTDNVAKRNGGAVYAVGRPSAPCVLDFQNVQILENSAGAEGGGVNFNSHCRGRFEEVEFQKNRSKNFGGGAVLLCKPGQTTEIEFKSCRFVLNSSRFGAGLQVGKNARARLVNCTLESNTSNGEGGGLLVKGANAQERGRVEVTGGRIVGNRAPKGGGIAVRNDGQITLTRVDVLHNRATLYGGGLFVEGTSKSPTAVSLLQTHIVDNTARKGGGVAIGGRVDFHADHVQFKDNTANEWGGGLFAQGTARSHARVDLVACAFQSNKVAALTGRRLRGRGEALRIGPSVEFDTAQLESCEVPHKRASLAAGVHAPPLASKREPKTAKPKRRGKATPPGVPAARRPDAPVRRDPLGGESAEGPRAATLPPAPAKGRALVEGDDDFGRALGHYVAAALAKDYHALRADRFRSTSSRMKSYEAKIVFPGVISTRIWDTGRRHYACVTLSNTAPDDEATKIFESYEARLQGHLGDAWTTRESTTRHKGRVREFHHEHVRLRLTLTRYELRSGARATVMLFFN